MLQKHKCEPNVNEEIFNELQEALDNEDASSLIKFFEGKSEIDARNCRWLILTSFNSDYIHKLAHYDENNKNKKKNNDKSIHISADKLHNLKLGQLINICNSTAVSKLDKETSLLLQELVCYGSLIKSNGEVQYVSYKAISALINATANNTNFDLATTEKYVYGFGNEEQIERFSNIEKTQILPRIEQSKAIEQTQSATSNAQQM